MKKLFFLLLTVLITGCASFQISTTNHDPIYDTVLIVSSDTKVDTLNEFQFRNKLRTDFNFRYDFAQYAISQPRSFDWNNRILGNRYNVYNPYYGFGYSNYWNRDQMWNDWVWGYPYSNGIGWSYSWRNNSWSSNSWNNHYGWNNYYGWNNWNGWGNGYGYNAWHQIYGRQQNVAHNIGRRGSNNVISRNIQNNRVVTNSRPRIINNKPLKEDVVIKDLDQYYRDLIKNGNGKEIKIYTNPNNVPKIVRNNNNSKPRVYVRPNNNNINNNPPRIYNRPTVNTSNSSTRSSNNVVRVKSNSRGGSNKRK